jgi:hypothetical protein
LAREIVIIVCQPVLVVLWLRAFFTPLFFLLSGVLVIVRIWLGECKIPLIPLKSISYGYFRIIVPDLGKQV